MPNSISIGSDVFAQLTAGCPYTLQWAAPFSLSKLPFYGGSGLGMLNSFFNIRSSFATIRCLFYITWSPSRWSTPDQAAITNGRQPTTTDRRQQQASNNPLKKPWLSPNDCITLCVILWCGRRVWGAAVGWVDRPGRACVVAETRPIANRFWVPSK